MTDIRPMRAGDEEGAEAAWDQAYRTLLVENHLPTMARTPELIDWGRRRMGHLQATDPAGCWVAEDKDHIVGIAQAHIRGEVWVLATLGVIPGFQDQGIGHELLDRTLAYGDPASPGAIFASPDPRAIYRYVSAGFELHPTATAFGPVGKPIHPQVGIREGSVADTNYVHDIDRTVRGADRGTDIEFQLSVGCQLLIDEEGGYAVIRKGNIAMLSALDENAATRLLLAGFAKCPPESPAGVGWITGDQQWAVRAVAKAGIPIYVHEAILMRGRWQPKLPYLPNGIFG